MERKRIYIGIEQLIFLALEFRTLCNRMSPKEWRHLKFLSKTGWRGKYLSTGICFDQLVAPREVRRLRKLKISN